MTDRLPGKYRSSLHTKPWFTSGKVPEIKYSYTQAGLTPSSYPIRPRSIVPGKRLDMHPVKSFFLNVDEKREDKPKREFKEYSFLRESEVLLTIEHCDNCEDHANSTRHDPMKYFQTAQTLKNAVLARYPMVKIITKPITKLDPVASTQRIGAFEVQISSKSRGKLIVELLHSKLVSRKWPLIPEVISRIAAYLPTFQLLITVFDEVSQDKPLKGLRVFLRSKPVDIEMPRPNTHYSSFRPKSAATTRSAKSFRIMSSRRLSSKQFSKAKPSPLFEKVTDRDGNCVFDSVPLDIYEIEVEETKEYQGTMKILNTFEEKVNNPSFNLFIGMKSRENSNITVVLRDNLLKEEVCNAKVLLQKSAEQYSLHEVRRGVYEISVPKGDYLLKVLSSKYKEVSRNIAAYEVETLVTECLDIKKVKEMSVLTYDAVTGAALSGVLIEVSVNNHASFEGLTKGGKHSFKVDEVGLFVIKTKISGYIKAKTSIIVGSNEINFISVPVVPCNLEHPLIVISWCRCSDDIEVQAMSTQALNLQSPEIEGFKLNDMLKSNGFACIGVLGEFKDLRVTVKVLAKELTAFNALMHSGISAQFYAWNRNVGSLRPTSGSGEIWDIGVYSARHKDFIETNQICSYIIGTNDILPELSAVIRQVENSDSVSAAFGFGHGISKVMSYGKDLFLSPEVFKKSVQGVLSNEFIPTFLQGLTGTDGVSLNSLMGRFNRYAGLARHPFKKIEDFMDAIEMDPEEDRNYRNIAEEGFSSQLPANWEIVFTVDGGIEYRNLNGEVTSEHPLVQIFRKKFFDQKKLEIKGKNKSVEVQKKQIEERKKEPERLNRKDSKASMNSMSSNKKIEQKLDESVESEPKKPKSASGSSEQLEEIDEFILTANQQCEKLAELAVKNIEFYNTIGQFDEEIHQQLMIKIDEYLENFRVYLKTKLKDEHRDFFTFWKDKFSEIKNILLAIAQDHKNNKHPRKKASNASPTSSKGSSKNRDFISDYED